MFGETDLADAAFNGALGHLHGCAAGMVTKRRVYVVINTHNRMSRDAIPEKGSDYKEIVKETLDLIIGIRAKSKRLGLQGIGSRGYDYCFV